MEKGRLVLAIAMMLILGLTVDVDARMRARNSDLINQTITTNTTITSDISGYWYIQSDQAVSVNVLGENVVTENLVIQQNGDLECFPLWNDKSTGMQFAPSVTTNLKILVLDQ